MTSLSIIVISSAHPSGIRSAETKGRLKGRVGSRRWQKMTEIRLPTPCCRDGEGRSMKSPNRLRAAAVKSNRTGNHTDHEMKDNTTPQIVTAGLMVIGDEILSGRTKDKNIGYIAEFLTAIGIDLREVRVVADDEDAIVEALNALRVRYSYVFTTGGIGPTHDDVTADSVAKAFGVAIDYDPRVVTLLKERYAAMGTELNAARMRMTRVPKGAELVPNKVSAAPGFWIDNVIVMAGVPSIMQAMLDEVAPQLRTGIKMLSETMRADCREGDVGTELGEIAKAHPEVMVGSYPFMDARGPNTHIVVRGRDPARLAAAKAAIEDMLERVRARLAAPG